MKLWAALLALALAGCQGSRAGAALTQRDRAMVYLAKNEPEKALAILAKLHREAPADLTIARALVEAHVKAGRVDELVRTLGAARTAVEHYMLALAYFSRAADAAGPAIDEFEQAIALAPGESELHYRLGLALVESEQYERSLSPLRKARALAPDRAAYALPLAKALLHLNKPQEAVAELRFVVTHAPSSTEVATARALMNVIADPYARVPQSARGRLEQGLEWLHGRDVPQEAIVTFEELVLEYPDLAFAHALLGLSYQRIDDAGRAVDEFRRAAELDPTDGRVHLYLGRLYLSRQRVRPAEEELSLATQLDPVLDDAWLTLGDLALERRDVPLARERYQVATWLLPTAAGPRSKLAAALQLERNWPAAERELLALADKEPDNLEYKLRLGLLHAEHLSHARTADERRYATNEGRKYLKQVLDAQPENALASRALDGLKSTKVP